MQSFCCWLRPQNVRPVPSSIHSSIPPLSAVLLLALLAAGPAGPAVAQDPGAAGVESQGTRIVYDQTYFQQFNALTAEDLLKTIPGIQELVRGAGGGGGQRGFGSTGDQILINGRRLAGKSNDIGSALQRIQASQVTQIEVIRGTVPGLDVRSEGTVINVVLNDVLVSGSGAWEASISRHSDPVYKPGGRLSYAGNAGALNYILAATATPFFDRRTRTEFFSLPGASPFERNQYDQRTEGTDLAGTVALGYTLQNGDLVNLNGRYADEGRTTTAPTEQYLITPGGEIFQGNTFNLTDLERSNWEVGGDYEHTTPGGNVVKALFVYNAIREHEAFSFFRTPVGGDETLTRLQLRSPDRAEKILRGSYQWAVTPAQRLEVGGEAAINTLDQLVRAFTYAGGVETELNLVNPDSRVKETRFEGFMTYSWLPHETLQIEGALDAEYSRLGQEGSDVSRSRNFFFLRPRLDVRYDVTPRNQIRARAQRLISQIDFADFVSSFSIDDLRNDVLTAGNPDLVPEKTWSFEAAYEHRLAADQGVFSLRAFYDAIEDHIALIPVSGGTLAAPGNTGSARRYGAEASMGLRLGWIGLPSASVDARYLFRDSSMTDAFTGGQHVISNYNGGLWSVSFRHDTAWNSLAYGFTARDTRPMSVYDIDVEHTANFHPDMEAFAEMRVFGSVTVRLDAQQIFRAGFHRDRRSYVGSRGLGVLRRIERRNVSAARELRLTLRGTF